MHKRFEEFLEWCARKVSPAMARRVLVHYGVLYVGEHPKVVLPDVTMLELGAWLNGQPLSEYRIDRYFIKKYDADWLNDGEYITTLKLYRYGDLDLNNRQRVSEGDPESLIAIDLLVRETG